MIENKILKCKKHNIDFNGKILLGRIVLGCPKCKAESEEIEKQREAQRLAQKELELLEYKEFRIKCSGLPKKLIETKAKYTSNFKAFSKHLMCLEKNLFICGGVGTGKSMYCAELIKRNTIKCPHYYLTSDLAYLTNSKKVEFLKSVENCELFVLDEISDLALIEESFLNALIDKLYNNNCLFVLCGNVSKEFIKSLNVKILSRLNAQGLEVCEFKGKDLRILSN